MLSLQWPHHSPPPGAQVRPSNSLIALYSGNSGVIFLCAIHRGGVTFNLITLFLCILVGTSEAEFNTVPPQLWLCAPLFLLCLVQVLEPTKVEGGIHCPSPLPKWVEEPDVSDPLCCPGRAQPALHGGDGFVWPWSLLRLFPLGEKDSKPWPRCHTYGLT